MFGCDFVNSCLTRAISGKRNTLLNIQIVWMKLCECRKGEKERHREKEREKGREIEIFFQDGNISRKWMRYCQLRILVGFNLPKVRLTLVNISRRDVS